MLLGFRRASENDYRRMIRSERSISTSIYDTAKLRVGLLSGIGLFWPRDKTLGMRQQDRFAEGGEFLPLLLGLEARKQSTNHNLGWPGPYGHTTFIATQ